MARNGSGGYSLPYPTFTSGTLADATQVTANNADLTAAIAQSLSKDGQTTPTANLPMGTYKLTGMGVGSAATDSVTLGQFQSSAALWAGTAGGAADALTLSPAPAITAYAAGQRFVFVSSASANTGAATVAISGLTTKAIELNGSALSADDILASKIYEIIYDGTAFQLNRLSAEYLSSDDIGSTVQAYDADILKADTSARIVANMGFTPVTDSSSSGAVTFDFSTGCICKITLTENITGITLSGAAAGDTLKIWFAQAAGGYTVSGWPAAVKWVGNTAPTMSSTDGAVDIITLEYDGTNYYGAYTQDHR